MNYFNYFSEIEETFNRRRGKHLFLSPLDWAMIETWQAHGIPLHIVLRGIESVFDGFDKKTGRKRQINSLMYCKDEIETLHDEWLESQTGKHEGDEDIPVADSSFSDESIKSHLESVTGELKAALKSSDNGLAETINRVLARLDELKGSYKDAESLEASLVSSEELLNEGLLQSENVLDFASQIESQLRGYRNKMDADAYKQTFELMLLKKLRDNAGIPRLSLFYI